MRRMQFAGLVSAEGVSSGMVTMDDLAERAAIYGAFYVTPNRDEVAKMVEMLPIPVSNCDGVSNRSGCFELKLTDLLTGFWPSTDGKLPADEPACGFRNEKCDYTLWIIAGALLVALLVAALIAFVVYRVMESRSLARMAWRIFRDDMRVLKDDEMKSMLSIGNPGGF